MEPYESELLKAWPIFDKVVLEGTIVEHTRTRCYNLSVPQHYHH